MRRRAKKHPEDSAFWNTSERAAREMLKKAPNSYRRRVAQIAKWKDGRKGLSKFRAFMGVPLPPSIQMLKAPGRKTVVGMGHANEIVYNDGSTKRRRGRWFGVFDASGRRILLINKRNMRRGIPSKPILTELGRMQETHYVVPRDVELAGSPKCGTHWIHKHRSQGGKWPTGYEDQNGNIWYAPGTYRIHRWIRR